MKYVYTIDVYEKNKDGFHDWIGSADRSLNISFDPDKGYDYSTSEEPLNTIGDVIKNNGWLFDVNKCYQLRVNKVVILEDFTENIVEYVTSVEINNGKVEE